ncbi:MAG: transglycosylase SLT domain-containing protein [Balneolaceae bacterium]|nr:transglycosylase SLT domain-containing protein [Balneolaceae bacterium]
MTSSFSISAELTYMRIRGLMGHFTEASKRYGIPLALLLAIASRESRMGLALSANGTGDYGNGIGIMQIDKRYHPDFANSHSPFDHQSNINYGAQYLASLIEEFNGNTHLAVAAYNGGPSRVRSAIYAGLPPDAVTTGGDYGKDVLGRGELIAQLMGLSKAVSLSAYLLPLSAVAFLTYNYINPQKL